MWVSNLKLFKLKTCNGKLWNEQQNRAAVYTYMSLQVSFVEITIFQVQVIHVYRKLIENHYYASTGIFCYSENASQTLNREMFNTNGQYCNNIKVQNSSVHLVLQVVAFTGQTGQKYGTY